MLPSSSLTVPDVQISCFRFFMEELCSRRCSDGRSGLPAEGDAPAALFRTVETARPTLIVDEVDNLFGRSSGNAMVCAGPRQVIRSSAGKDTFA
jgi:hypothetical protein